MVVTGLGANNLYNNNRKARKVIYAATITSLLMTVRRMKKSNFSQTQGIYYTKPKKLRLRNKKLEFFI